MADFVTLNLNFDAIGYAASIIITLFVLLFAVRIPFRRRYHKAFLVYVTVVLLWSLAAFVAQLSGTPDVYLERARFGFILGSPLQIALLYQFVLLFVGSRMSLLRKLTLAAAYAYVAFYVGALIIDPGLFLSTPSATATGWIAGAGSLSPYVTPFGVSLILLLLDILIFTSLVPFYRSEKASLVRQQIRYLSGGILLYSAGIQAFYLAVYFGGANLLPFLVCAAMAVILIGLRKHGFYLATPVGEKVRAVARREGLEGGGSYRTFDKDEAFGVFSGLTREGYDGLCIARTYPDEIRKKFGLEVTPIRWLAEQKGEDIIPPQDLLGLSLTIKDFLNKAPRPVIMLQGVEYLVTVNGFTPILRLLRDLSPLVSEKHAILIIPVVPNALREEDQRLLNQATRPMPSNQE
jgi:hypothetical protein